MIDGVYRMQTIIKIISKKTVHSGEHQHFMQNKKTDYL